jgi:predicted pyridoxine 5'-phosphate oxidase superfamily flavin-nucleotide-binding protein
VQQGGRVSEALADLQERTFGGATPATSDSYPQERRLSGDQLAAYLDRRDFAVVGSTRPDGRPHLALSSYVRRGTTFWLPAVARSVRERNIRAQPWTTLVVNEGDHNLHIAVIIEGRAEVVAKAEVPPDVSAAISGDWIALWIVLRAERLLSYAAEGALS